MPVTGVHDNPLLADTYTSPDLAVAKMFVNVLSEYMLYHPVVGEPTDTAKVLPCVLDNMMVPVS
jgi:hypothetical protein